jgi:hypothetical protein
VEVQVAAAAAAAAAAAIVEAVTAAGMRESWSLLLSAHGTKCTEEGASMARIGRRE